MRVGVYYAPAVDDPLWTAASVWLGRDPANGTTPAQPVLPNVSDITADARRYGFHATLKPPMQLRPTVGLDDLLDKAREILCEIPRFDLPTLAVADLHGFLALREIVPCPPLHALADTCVVGLDEFREPPDAAELQRRRKSGLSPQREAMLVRWGYPDVFQTWQFHMTLTRRLAPAERAVFEPAAAAHFASALLLPRRVTDVCLFVEDAPGAPFRVVERVALG